MTSMTSTRKVAVPVAGSRIWTKGSSGEMVFFSPGSSESGGNFICGCFFSIAPQVVVSARPSARPNSRLQEFVDAADDVGDDGLRSVKHAALRLELSVVLLQEILIEVNHRVFLTRSVPKVPKHCIDTRLRIIEQVHHFLDSEFVEIQLASAAAGL